MGTHIKTKQEYREEMRQQLRKAFDEDAQEMAADSYKAGKKFRTTGLYMEASIIFGFLPCKTEIDMTSMILRAFLDGKDVAVPRVVPGTNDMDFYVLDPTIPLAEQTETGSFGITEPKTTLVKVDVQHFPEKALLLVPGLVFSQHQGERVGKGKGFYDRYISLIKKYNQGTHLPIAYVGYCFSMQVDCHVIPVDEGDQPMDYLMNEHGLLQAKTGYEISS